MNKGSITTRVGASFRRWAREQDMLVLAIGSIAILFALILGAAYITLFGSFLLGSPL